MRTSRLIFLGLMVCLWMPIAAAQQDEFRPMWNLSTVFTVEDLGFTFNYPAGWVFDASDGITLAENAADLARLLDTDDRVQPRGYTIRLLAAPAARLDLDGATLDEIVDALLPQAGIHTVYERFDLGVMGRRTVNIHGTNTVGRGGIATLWLQDDHIVIFNLGSPRAVLSLDGLYTWGMILGTLTPLDILTAADDPLLVPVLGLDLLYPLGWHSRILSNPPEVLLYELEEDYAETAGRFRGLVVDIADLRLRELGLGSGSGIEDVLQALAAALGVRDVQPGEEFMTLEYVLPSVKGTDDAGRVFTIAAALDAADRDLVHVYSFSAPDEAAWRDFYSTWLMLLNSLEELPGS